MTDPDWMVKALFGVEPEHRKSRDCWCRPRVEVYEGADVVIHNSRSEAN